MIVAPDLTALSNGPEIERTTLDDGRVRVVFADTMSMSTYLVAFVVGNLELTDPVDAGGVPTRVAHVPGKGPLASFALEVGAHSLTWFADYYGIPYPDKKVDHIALPDFAQGAMENLGCITYREAALLVDPATSTHGEQLDVAETVAHELAHMWFGDLVTMRWWNGLWLNEAFATFMAMLAVDAYRPDWEVWNQFARSRSAALEVDALDSTRSIEYPVHSPDDANGMFDTLTYLKGGAILRMLEQYLGADRFRDGIRRYLRKHAYGNTETHDLWDALEGEDRRAGPPDHGHLDLAGRLPVDLGHDRRRRNAPVLPAPVLALASRRRHQVGRAAAGSPGGSRRQRAHRRDPGRGRRRDAPRCSRPTPSSWRTPAASASSACGTTRCWPADWRAPPCGRSARWNATRSSTTRGRPSSTVRRPPRRSAGSWRGSRDETELPVWQLILTGLSWCDRFLEGEPRDRFRDYVRNLLRPAIDRLGWEASSDEPDLVRALRGTLAQALAVLGRRPGGEGADARAGGRIPGRRGRRRAPRLGGRSGGGDERRCRRLRPLLADGARRVTPQEQLRYLYALARFRDPDLFDRLLASTLTDDVRPQDAPFLLATATTNRDLGDRAWRFIADHWDEAVGSVRGLQHHLPRRRGRGSCRCPNSRRRLRRSSRRTTSHRPG